MDRIILKDLLARGRIGISDKERERPQDILINIEMQTDIHQAGLSDNLLDCVDYSETAKAVLALVEDNNRKTLEALTTDIADYCLQHPLVRSVKVRVEKTAAVRFAKSAGVEIEREKNNSK
ncbi:MAG TPA: dihydroneopterin aldolase [Flexilinea sp.]|nr:dihydroneopterin aldolase [Flexilinea sp.]